MIKDKSQMLWFLEGELRDNSPWIIPIHRDPFLIGRLDTSDLILSSSAVSRKHAELQMDCEDLFITDLKSKNGTFLNGKELHSKALLHNGDLLKIGISEFKVHSKLQEQEKENNSTLVGFKMDKDLSFSDYYQLSTRESEILFFLIKAFSLQEIGEKLFISSGTVKNHVLKIYKKTDCHSRIELSTKYSDFLSSDQG
ncbi:MAG: FHA domain-containing protein [Spirochaetaceae bacterium]|jgi:pSer/pThr/pTyr-binding forkhead associated (FHA) protein|nr:FHA domain-containing protein [Spirochaetaceae bacterium]